MTSARSASLNPVALWILYCTFCNCVGWLLSALHWLNPIGYAVAFVVGFAALAFWVRNSQISIFPAVRLAKLRWRFRHLFPLCFALMALLAFLGGALHGPSNYDATAYRIPRVLHWLAEGRWHWIHTDFHRVNTRACGIEWLSAPVVAFSGTDRLLFLINIAAFLLLPGLIFSVFRQVGIKARAAWHWMWLLPTGYCYILQAGSVSNDMFSAAFSLAAIDFALRARKSGRVFDCGLSILSVALLIGAKTSNLPLLLPWVVAFAPTWRIWFTRPMALAAFIPFAFGASFLPMALLNQVCCGDWTGVKAEHVILANGPAWLYLFVNAVYMITNNLVPPVFPFASVWNRAVDAHLPASLAILMQHTYYFEPPEAHLRLPEIQLEEHAGLGFGVTILLASSAAVAWFGPKREPARCSRLALRLLCLAPWVSLAYLMTKMDGYGSVRYLASYYPLLGLGLLRAPVQAKLVRCGWWRTWAALSCALGLMLLIVSPDRPLWPAMTFFDRFGHQLEANPAAAQAMATYRVKHDRPYAFAPILKKLPPDVRVLGLYADDWPEASLWKPFGSRRILHCKLSDSPAELQHRGLKYLLVQEENLNEPWAEWTRRMDVRDLLSMPLQLKGTFQPATWHLVELEPTAGDAARQRAPTGATRPITFRPPPDA